MTMVYCGFTDCTYNKDGECNKDKIYLDELVADINIGCPDAKMGKRGREMKLAFIVSAIGIAGFIFLAWQFNHWWIALFGLLFMYDYERKTR